MGTGRAEDSQEELTHVNYPGARMAFPNDRSDATQRLLEACEDADTSGVKAALAAGAAVAHAGQNGMSGLHFAAGIRVPIPAVSICQTLLAAGANVNARDVWGNTPLHHAALNKDYGVWVCRLLLAWHANPKLINQAGDSPGDIAKRKGMEEFH